MTDQNPMHQRNANWAEAQKLMKEAEADIRERVNNDLDALDGLIEEKRPPQKP